VAILRRASQAGKRSIQAHYDAESRNQVVGKGRGGDYTLRIDQASEKAIFSSLKKDLGKDSFIFFSEEMGEQRPEGIEGPVIICDPLDGSHNAQVGIPIFSISLAVVDNSSHRRFSDVNVAFIQSVATNDEFYAIKGHGSFHNRKRIPPASDSKIRSTRLTTLGFECGDISYVRSLISNLTTEEVYKFRLLGSAALAFCYLAVGTYQGFAFVQPNGARSIDSPAGYLIAREAGCIFSDLEGKFSDVGSCVISFESKINLVGARTSEMLQALLGTLRRNSQILTKES
jgi:myo-inositol-1(or 4)-monophosphatase